MQNFSNVKLLLLFPKNRDLESVAKSKAQVHSRLQTVLGLTLTEDSLVTSNTWFDKTFHLYHDWDSWTWNTVHAKNYNTRDFNFSGFIIMTDQTCLCGRATATIAETAMRKERLVLHDDGQCLRAVTEIEKNESLLWHDGWTVHSAQIC
jgi:hypothetical protein